MTRLAPLALLPAFSLPLQAEMFSWHSADFGLRLSDGWQVVLSERTRTRHEFTYFDQQRAGAVVRWSPGRRLTPFAGYYFQPQQPSDDKWVRGHRFFAGVEAPFALGSRATLVNRLAAERFIDTDRPDYNRVRTYSRASFGTGRAIPFVQAELLAVRQGFHSFRASGGMRFRLSPRAWFEAGYLYDCRRTFWGGDRHAVFTAIRLDSGKRR